MQNYFSNPLQTVIPHARESEGKIPLHHKGIPNYHRLSMDYFQLMWEVNSVLLLARYSQLFHVNWWCGYFLQRVVGEKIRCDWM